MTFITNDKQDHTYLTKYNIDVNSAYNNAIMWMLTGKQGYADRAIEVFNAWSILTEINGSDRQLARVQLFSPGQRRGNHPLHPRWVGAVGHPEV